MSTAVMFQKLHLQLVQWSQKKNVLRPTITLVSTSTLIQAQTLTKNLGHGAPTPSITSATFFQKY